MRHVGYVQGQAERPLAWAGREYGNMGIWEYGNMGGSMGIWEGIWEYGAFSNISCVCGFLVGIGWDFLDSFLLVVRFQVYFHYSCSLVCHIYSTSEEFLTL